MRANGTFKLKSTSCAIDDIVIAWVAMGLSLKEIGRNLGYRNRATVNTHIQRRIENRLKIAGPAAYTRYAIVHGLIPCEV